MPRTHVVRARLLALLATLGPAVLLSGQEGSVEGTQVTVLPDVVHPATNLDVPRPPRALWQHLPAHPNHLPLREGPPGNPPPADAPTAERAGGTGVLAAPGDFTWIQNQVVDLGNAQRTYVGEPSIAFCQDTAFVTGNWYARLSGDGGMSWSGINPFTRFPSLDNGFTGDQRTIYIPSHDITVWLMLYVYSDTTRQGSYRLAVSRGRAGLRDNVWYSYVFDGNVLGYGDYTVLDYPDLTYSGDFLWLTSHVFDGRAGQPRKPEIIWRLSLDQLAAAAGLTVTRWWGPGGSDDFRFAQGATGGTMFFACHQSTTQIRLFRCVEPSTSLSWVDRAVAPWSNQPGSAIGPDGRNWAVRASGWVHTGYANADEVGYLWGSSQHGVRPWPYVRVARFRTSDLTLISEHDLWSPNHGLGYPAAMTNARGDVGATVTVGGGPHHPHTSAFLVDSYDPWPPTATYASAAGTNAVPDARWGDFFTLQRHPRHTQTFLATGQNQNGGATEAFHEPRLLWFAREEERPSWVDLTVTSTPVAATITVDAVDRNGLAGGLTSFTRSYAPQQGYTLTAPIAVSAGGAWWVFHHWSLATVAGGLYIDRPLGEQALVVDSIGDAADSARATYVPRRTLTVTTNHPASLAITLSPADVYGILGGSTPLTRYYRDGTLVNLTAPAGGGGSPFKRWVLNNVGQAPGLTSVSVTMGAAVSAVAEYWSYTPGTFTPFGAGCAGTLGIPVQSPAPAPLPETGHTVSYNLTSGPPNSVAVLVLGFSNTQWLGIPLPLPLTGAPGCTIYHDMAMTLAAPTTMAGAASVGIPVPADPSLVGGHYYTQFWGIDPSANSLGLSFTRAVDTRVGGLR